MRCLYGNYGAEEGRILLRHRGAVADLVTADPRLMREIRRDTLGHVSQFLRVIPRVPAIEIVAEPLIARGLPRDAALARAEALLARLNLPARLHHLPPATFSGGEQQRVNLARGFAPDYPILLLDEPTASLDAANREVVIGLIAEAKARGAAIIGIFHDAEVRGRVADRLFDVAPLPEVA
jgi:alpha-D-ribose 1-methylphosphonate 5-triphosphate synthase subunit PhnL